MSPTAVKRVPELDGLRGLAAALVVVHHLWPQTFAFGWAAVDLFFVLSGYLITGICLENGDKKGFFPAFYARRSLRIWPIYYLAIFAALLCTRPEPGAVPYYLVYLQNLPGYWAGRMPVWHEMAHTWTLAIEEQFYLIWPALMLIGRRPGRAAFLALGVAMLSLLARSGGLASNLLPARCDGFALGGLLACLRATGRMRSVAVVTGVAATGAVCALAWSYSVTGSPLKQLGSADVTASTLLSFVLVVVVLQAAGSRATALLRLRPVVYLGVISYGLYLYHYPILLRSYSLSMRLGLYGTSGEPFLVGFLSVLTAVLSWHLIEQPILRLKDFVPYRKTGAAKLGTAVRSGHGAKVAEEIADFTPQELIPAAKTF
jgi:peptidoglycan/LPS O-acetylase OafA/YrhL